MDPLERLDAELLEARIKSSEPEASTTEPGGDPTEEFETLTAEQVAAMLHVGAPTVTARMAEGKIPGAFRLFDDGPWRITRANFRRFLQDSALKRAGLDVNEIMKRGDTQPCHAPHNSSSAATTPTTSATPIPLSRKRSGDTPRSSASGSRTGG